MNEILVLGIGNPLLGDDGFGVEVVRRLREGDCPNFRAPTRSVDPKMGLSPSADPQAGLPPSVDILDGGAMGLALLPHLEGRSHILVVDAINFGGRPGEVVRLHAANLPACCGQKLSEHQVTFHEVVALMDLMEIKPRELIFIGVQPRSTRWGDPLSPEVEAAIPGVIEEIAKEIAGWASGVPHAPLS